MKKLSAQPSSNPITRKVVPVLAGVVLVATGCTVGEYVGEPVGEPAIEDAGEPGTDAGSEDAGTEDAGTVDVDGGSNNDAG